MAQRRPFQTDPVLTGIAIGYRNRAQSLIADDVLPRVPVGSEKFAWTKYPLAEGFTLPDSLVGRRGRVNRVEFTGTEVDDSTDDHGFESEIPNSDIDEARKQREAGLSLYDPEAHAAEGLADLLLLAREVRVAQLVQASSSYSASRRLVLSGTDRFSDYENSDPIAVIKAALEGTLIYRPNTLVMGQSVWSKLSSHPHLVNAVRGNVTSQGIITREEFARLFEIQRLLVGESFVNLAHKGQDPNLARVWGKSIQALYIDPNARPQRGVTFGFTAQCGTKIGGRIEDPNIGLEGGHAVRIGEKVKECVVAPDVGFQIADAVA
ncbi:capsid protein [Chelatococcus sp.]|uniref:capsid protein n=1 Tax=Chelatococcus sp. TaxID=1953771 RepID=UPI001EB52B5C|nr:capsid protein [Chelatococcus sp.]MBX3545584.1 capsid protein [Chelatococcus sp.]